MTRTQLDRRTYLAGIGAAGLVGLAGCTGTSDENADGGETGVLATQVTDQPGDIADFESCVVTITGMWLGSEEADADESDDDDETNENDDTDAEDDVDTGEEEDDDEEDEEENEDDEEDDEAEDEDEDDEEEDEVGREYHEYEEPQTADLVQLQGESTQLVDERELDTGSYEYLQLEIADVDATLESGDSAMVQVPGNAPLKFNESFEIRANTRTSFTGDFTPVKRGNAGGYNLQPVARGVEVEYEEIDEGDADDSNEDDSVDNTSSEDTSDETVNDDSTDGTSDADNDDS